MNNKGKIIIGVLLVLVGINQLLDKGGYGIQLNFNGWWTLFIIVPAAVSIKEQGIQLGNAITLTMGIVLLLNAQGYLPSFGDYFFPIVLVILGGWMMFAKNRW